MSQRMLFVTLLLFAELTLSVTAGLFGGIPARLGMAAAFLLPLLRLLRAPAGTPPIALRPSPAARPALLLLPHFILLTAAVSALSAFLFNLLGLPHTGATPMPTPWAAVLFDAAIPAVCEEMFFRGAIFAALRPMGRRAAVLGSALLFALMHANPAQLAYALVAGVMLGLLHELTGSLLYPVLFHFANNLVSLLFHFVGHTALLIGALAVAAAVCTLLLLPTLRKATLPARETAPWGFLREFFLSPLLLWLAVILILTVL